jgi:hypothetical protein
MGQVYTIAPATATPVDHQALRDAWMAFLGRWEWEWFLHLHLSRPRAS